MIGPSAAGDLDGVGSVVAVGMVSGHVRRINGVSFGLDKVGIERRAHDGQQAQIVYQV